MDLTSRAQWLAAGFSGDELRGLLRTGRLTRVRRGRYVQGGLPDDALARHDLQIRAAVGELASDAVVSHVSAAVLHGLRIWGVRLDRVHVTRRRATGGRCGALVHVHSATLDPLEIVMIGGTAVTSLARTVADLGRMLSFELAVVFCDSAMFHARTDRVEVADVLDSSSTGAHSGPARTSPRSSWRRRSAKTPCATRTSGWSAGSGRT